ncbi:MAG: hypothetical protein ACRCZZ_07720, partial [Phocaeicola sp.]
MSSNVKRLQSIPTVKFVPSIVETSIAEEYVHSLATFVDLSQYTVPSFLDTLWRLLKPTVYCNSSSIDLRTLCSSIPTTDNDEGDNLLQAIFDHLADKSLLINQVVSILEATGKQHNQDLLEMAIQKISESFDLSTPDLVSNSLGKQTSVYHKGLYKFKLVLSILRNAKKNTLTGDGIKVLFSSVITNNRIMYDEDVCQSLFEAMNKSAKTNEPTFISIIQKIQGVFPKTLIQLINLLKPNTQFVKDAATLTTILTNLNTPTAAEKGILKPNHLSEGINAKIVNSQHLVILANCFTYPATDLITTTALHKLIDKTSLNVDGARALIALYRSFVGRIVAISSFEDKLDVNIGLQLNDSDVVTLFSCANEQTIFSLFTSMHIRKKLHIPQDHDQYKACLQNTITVLSDKTMMQNAVSKTCGSGEAFVKTLLHCSSLGFPKFHLSLLESFFSECDSSTSYTMKPDEESAIKCALINL